MEKKGLFVGLIPDGNRRWVNNNPLLYRDAYHEGAESVSRMLKSIVRDDRVKIFSAWGLSDDNVRRRSEAELDILNGLFCEYLDKLRADLQTPDYEMVRLVHLGDRQLLQRPVLDRLDRLSKMTKARTEKIFAVCLAQGGREELERASNRKLLHHSDTKEILPLTSFLDFPVRSGLPFQPVDMIVRTGTDRPYTSAYLTGYQTGGTEEYFIPKLLPDTTPEDLRLQIDRFTEQQQRRGA